MNLVKRHKCYIAVSRYGGRIVCTYNYRWNRDISCHFNSLYEVAESLQGVFRRLLWAKRLRIVGSVEPEPGADANSVPKDIYMADVLEKFSVIRTPDGREARVAFEPPEGGVVLFPVVRYAPVSPWYSIWQSPPTHSAIAFHDELVAVRIASPFEQIQRVDEP